jgi:hypothetical protein
MANRGTARAVGTGTFMLDTAHGHPIADAGGQLCQRVTPEGETIMLVLSTQHSRSWFAFLHTPAQVLVS